MENDSHNEAEMEQELRKLEGEINDLERARTRIAKKLQERRERAGVLQAKLKKLKNDQVSSIDWANNVYEWRARAQEALEKVFKLKVFRHQQLGAINATLSGKDVMLVMPTGGGKSLCYQLPAVISKGMTLVISPLLSLIDDQIMTLKKLNVKAVALNSSNSKETSKYVYEQMSKSDRELKLLYVTPEWMAKSKRFMTNLQKCYDSGGLDRIAIDEVHCCSQWGHDFRPDYAYLSILKKGFPSTPVIGLTATATEKIIADTQEMLELDDCVILKASYDRPNLYYSVILKPTGKDECAKTLAEYARNRADDSGIIYTTTINDCAELAASLEKRGVAAACYHANMDPSLRHKVHERWSAGAYKVVVATVAFGMGIDKSDVRYVIHHSLPKNVECYYQESGRAGRDGRRADCYVMYSLKDVSRISCLVAGSRGSGNLWKMVEYCLSATECRRKMLSAHFNNEDGCSVDGPTCDGMCDNCASAKSDETEPRIIGLKTRVQELVGILDLADEKEIRLTATKLLDAWFQSGKYKSIQPPGQRKPPISRETAEHVVAFSLARGYLREEIHFTPYSNISYLRNGRKSVPDDAKMALPVSRGLTTSGGGGNGKRKKRRERDDSTDEESKKACVFVIE